MPKRGASSMNKSTSKNQQKKLEVKAKNSLDAEMLENYFAASKIDHSMTNIHFTVHSIFIAAITLLINSESIKTDIVYQHFVLFLIIVGLLGARNTYIAVKRARSYLNFWICNDEYKEMQCLAKKIEDFINKDSKFNFNKTREFMVKLFFSIYSLFLIYTILRMIRNCSCFI